MATHPVWRPLPLPDSSSIPVLLVSIGVETAAYTVRITDLANMWVESLDRKAICMRGWGENTTIDPSDTPENMAKFLASIRSALDTSQPGNEQTSVSLSPASPSDAGEGGLTLKVTCNLPGLQPLKWPIHLRKASPSVMATDLFLPLIQAHHSRRSEIESLVAMLGQKDAVLAKLLDKLEATGTGLEHVFNSLSGRKKVSRSVAEDRIKGLAPFNRRQWENAAARGNGPDSASSLVHEVFGGDGVRHHGSLEIEESPKLDRWWLDFKGTLQISQRNRPTESQQIREPQSPPGDNAVDEDDDFQVQATPPHLTSTRHKEPNPIQPADNVSTDSEDDGAVPSRLAEESSPPKAPPPQTKPKASVSRLGVIGGKKQSAPKRTPTPEPSNDKGNVPRTDMAGSDTASDVADDETASSPEHAPPRSPPKRSAPQKGRLGRIGGQSMRPDAAQREEDAPNEDASGEMDTAPPPSRPPKLGMIGRGRESKISTGWTSKGDDERGRHLTRENPEDKDEPRETSTERADRRREELKRELEKKAAAGPAKKKRRF